MPPISKPEVRFKEGSGIQFLDNGKIRCHALARSRMREYREKFNDYDTPADDLWPECQCGLAAEEGQYTCRYHGGLTPRRVNPPRTMLDVMPLEMAEKFKAVMDSPEYISRKDDINLIRTRIVMLLEELSNEADSEEAWGNVSEALLKLRKGDIVKATEYLEEALRTTKNKDKVWKEIYQTEKLLGELTVTQIKTAKELQSMATVEQVNALISTLLHVILNGAQNYIADPMLRMDFTRTIVREIQQLTGTTPHKMMIDAEHTD
jgi:hypothetical protein